jgi:hypothetical protein
MCDAKLALFGSKMIAESGKQVACSRYSDMLSDESIKDDSSKPERRRISAIEEHERLVRRCNSEAERPGQIRKPS